MPETRSNPIWRLWMADYTEAIQRVKKERQRADQMFSASHQQMQGMR